MDLNANSPAAPVDQPQTRAGAAPPGRSRRWIIWLVAGLALLAGIVLLVRRRAAPQPEKAPANKAGDRSRGGGAIPVSVATVEKGNMGDYINGLGTVTSVYTITLTSRVAGTLVDVRYREGQMVRKGQLLAVIDPRPYQASYMQAEGQLERDQATLANARIDLERYRAAFAQHAVPEQTVATQQAAVNQNQGTVKVDQGNLAAAQVNLDYTQIRAPVDGRVGLRSVDPGNIVQANGTAGLLTITQLQPITVIFTMAEDYLSQVVPQLQAGHRMRVDALSRDDRTPLAQGYLLTVDNLVDTTTGTVRARASFTNRDFKLFPNEFVNARLLVKTLMGVNILPNAAIQRNNDQSFVYVVKPDQSVQSRNISVTTTDGDRSAANGVKPGEVVVTDGFDKLQDGAKVAARKPANGGRETESKDNGQTPAQRQPENSKQSPGGEAK